MSKTKEISARIKIWTKILKRINLISNQKRLQEIITREDGQPSSQPYVSALINGGQTVPVSVIEKLHKAFPFTPFNYFKGQAPMIEFDALLEYIIREQDIQKTDIAKALDIRNSEISVMINEINNPLWNKVFDYLNATYGYNLSMNFLLQKETTSKADNKNMTGDTERLFEFISFLKKKGRIDTDVEFAESIKISPQQLQNIKHYPGRYTATKQMLIETIRVYDFLSPDWILLGNGSMFRTERPFDIEIKKLLKDSEQQSSIIFAIEKKLSFIQNHLINANDSSSETLIN